MTIRCAIYTRRSTEEGLEQAFNSLDAQQPSALEVRDRFHPRPRVGGDAVWADVTAAITEPFAHPHHWAAFVLTGDPK